MGQGYFFWRENSKFLEILTLVEGDDGVDDLPDGERGRLLLGVLAVPDEPPVDHEDDHRHDLDRAAHADVPGKINERQIETLSRFQRPLILY